MLLAALLLEVEHLLLHVLELSGDRRELLQHLALGLRGGLALAGLLAVRLDRLAVLLLRLHELLTQALDRRLGGRELLLDLRAYDGLVVTDLRDRGRVTGLDHLRVDRCRGLAGNARTPEQPASDEAEGESDEKHDDEFHVVSVATGTDTFVEEGR